MMTCRRACAHMRWMMAKQYLTFAVVTVTLLQCHITVCIIIILSGKKKDSSALGKINIKHTRRRQSFEVARAELAVPAAAAWRHGLVAVRALRSLFKVYRAAARSADFPLNVSLIKTILNYLCLIPDTSNHYSVTTIHVSAYTLLYYSYRFM